MNSMAQRIAALAIMTGVSVGAASAYNSYQYSLVMTVNGEKVSPSEYATNMIFNMKNIEDQLAMFGITDVWSNEENLAALSFFGIDPTNIDQTLAQAAQDQTVQMYVINQNMEKLGLSLSTEQEQELTDMRSGMMEQLGGEEAFKEYIASFGFDDAGFDAFMRSQSNYAALANYYYGENGVDVPTKEELLASFKENYIQAKHILIQTVDASGEEIRTDDQAKTEAQSLLERIRAGEDFDALMNQFSEDPGSSSNPNGYIFTEGDMVQPFYEGAKALQDNEVSDPIKTDYGYHIIKRVPLDYEGQLENYRPALLNKMGKSMDMLLTGWVEQAKVNTTELYNQINHKNVYEYAPVAKPENTIADNTTDETTENPDFQETAPTSENTESESETPADSSDPEGAAPKTETETPTDSSDPES